MSRLEHRDRIVQWVQRNRVRRAVVVGAGYVGLMMVEACIGMGLEVVLVEAGDQDAPYMSTIWSGDAVVGETTSGAWGYRINASVALGVVRTDLAEPGTRLEVEMYGKRYPATVQPDQPLWDPENERLRA